jgi:hypothetical protein
MQNRTKLIEQHVKELVKECNNKKNKTEEDLQEIEKSKGFLAKGQPLFIGRQGPLDNQAISGIISELIEKSGLDGNNGFKPTSLRDALEDALVEANVNHKIKEALMGHVSDIEHEYGGANRLKVTIVEAMKKAYPFLTLNGLTRVSTDQHVSKEEFEAMKKQLADFKEEMGSLKEYRDRLVELENQLYADRRLFEEELGIDDEGKTERKRKDKKQR